MEAEALDEQATGLRLHRQGGIPIPPGPPTAFVARE
jgi:hypothetical protein